MSVIAMKKREKKEFNMQLHKPQAHMHVGAFASTIVKSMQEIMSHTKRLCLYFFGNNAAICVLENIF